MRAALDREEWVRAWRRVTYVDGVGDVGDVNAHGVPPGREDEAVRLVCVVLAERAQHLDADGAVGLDCGPLCVF